MADQGRRLEDLVKQVRRDEGSDDVVAELAVVVAQLSHDADLVVFKQAARGIAGAGVVLVDAQVADVVVMHVGALAVPVERQLATDVVLLHDEAGVGVGDPQVARDVVPRDDEGVDERAGAGADAGGGREVLVRVDADAGDLLEALGGLGRRRLARVRGKTGAFHAQLVMVHVT